MDSRQILALVGGSTQHVLKRLQRLFHHGYLDRPRAQVNFFSREGSRPFVYALGSAGARASSEPHRSRPRHDNRNVKQLHLQHTLLVADVMLAFEKARRSSGAPQIFFEEDIAPEQLPSAAFKWAVTLRHGDETKRVGVLPDRALLLQSPKTGERMMIFVEADRATMPVTRRSLNQSSLLRKLFAYEATWTQEILKKRFGCSRFRVLIVTTSTERIQHVVETAARLTRGRGLFLVTDAATLRVHAAPFTTENVFNLPWRNARGEPERLVLE
ncbi:MAG: replication-relaxation family protein [Verrucomicrobia bacterium]|nr:replication-relaxation family protein [Verrucomicrobiota bacterium]